MNRERVKEAIAYFSYVINGKSGHAKDFDEHITTLVKFADRIIAEEGKDTGNGLPVVNGAVGASDKTYPQQLKLPERLIETLDIIIADCSQDVKDFDGRDFNGKTLGELHGILEAKIEALAKVLKKILDYFKARE